MLSFPSLVCCLNSNLSLQVLKFGNESQIGLIAEEVGGAVGAAPLDAQIELFNALIDGCRDAVEVGSLDQKVCDINTSIYSASLQTATICI